MRMATGKPAPAERALDGADASATRVAVLGVSLGSPCGVHEHALRLADALQQEQIACSLHWLWRTEAPFAASRAQMRSWTERLSDELREQRPQALLLHYSVFAFSFRGLPVFVHPVLSVVRELRIPMVALLHEYAYPWRRGGIRGAAWALTQRLLLRDVMHASAAVVATTDFRAEWLASRAWLPRRPTALAPVFSNLPAPAAPAASLGGGAGAPDRGARALIGLFGYAHEGVDMALVLDALRLLQDRGVKAELLLVGAPGRSSAAGESWLDAARARGIAQPPAFTGVLSAQDLADTLSGCELLLSADRIGPTSRRTTLAASLAAGRPVVALDGRHSWRELREAGAALLVAPIADALAGALVDLIEDEGTRAVLARRSRDFAMRAMSVDRSARVVGALLHEVAEGSPSAAASASGA